MRSRTLRITGQPILNQETKFDIRIVPGGIYYLEKNVSYPDIEENINAGNLKVIEGSIEIAEIPTADSVDIEVSIDTPKEEDKVIVEEVADSTDSDKPEKTSTVVPDTQKETFICDICGEEFASARSLSAHRSRAHRDKK